MYHSSDSIRLNKLKKLAFSRLLKRKHDPKSITFWLAFAGLIIGIAAILFVLIPIFNPKNDDHYIFKDIGYRLWANYFTFFTNQTNLFLVIYYILFFSCFKTRLFDNRNLTIAMCTYINLVMITYWTAMFPTWANNGEMDSTWNTMIASIIFHLICPIIYNLFCFLNPSYPYKNGFINPIKRIDNKIYSFILWAYLLFYSVYAITINYIQLPAHVYNPIADPGEGHRYFSVYGNFTNFNTKAYNVVYIDGHPRYDLNSSGNPVQLLGLAAMGILYFVIEKLVFAYNNFLTTPVEMRNESLYLNYKYNDSKKAIYEKYCKDALKSIKEIEQNNKK